MRRYILLFYTLLGILPVLSAQPAPKPPPDTPQAAEAAIRAVLAAQAAAWNRGDVAAYMAAGYWDSNSLMFLSATGPTVGYAATLARYRLRYPTAERMGKLHFELIRVDLLSPTSAFVAGRWTLQRAQDAPAGVFTLLWRRINGRWVIVVDHSS
jgi:ketosteroid isomerase-like protein